MCAARWPTTSNASASCAKRPRQTEADASIILLSSEFEFSYGRTSPHSAGPIDRRRRQGAARDHRRRLGIAADAGAARGRRPDEQAETRHSAGLMRVNHVGEVCAQALYNSQSRFAKTEEMRAQFEQAGREEEDHLAWTAQRLGELNSHISVLNPLFYAGAYALGTVAAVLGDARSLGFVVETERDRK